MTRQRLHHLTPAAVATCSQYDAQVEEDLQHALIDFSYNHGAGQALLHTVQVSMPELSVTSLLRLELPRLTTYVDAELSTVTFISTVLQEIWNTRFVKTRILLFDLQVWKPFIFSLEKLGWSTATKHFLISYNLCK